MSRSRKTESLSSRQRKRRRKPKPARVWIGGRYQTTAAPHGQESQRGYPVPRRKWSSLSAVEREQRALERLAYESPTFRHIPHSKPPA